MTELLFKKANDLYVNDLVESSYCTGFINGIKWMMNDEAGATLIEVKHIELGVF